MSDNELIACQVCLKEIPRSVAQSEEGVDYVYYFCGDACYQEWLAAAREMREIKIVVDGTELDFDGAQALARTVAATRMRDALLLAWRDQAHGRVSPEIPECQHEPGWLTYARSRGASLEVNVNGGAYSFLFGEAA